MDFLESVQSKFQKYHKKNNITEFRKLRSTTHRITQKEQRLKKMDEGRNLQDANTPGIVRVKASASMKRQASPHVDRLTKLKIWKKERDNKMNKQKAEKKPTFKVGAPKHVGFPTLKPEFVSFAPKNHIFKPPQNLKDPSMKKTEESKVILRVTRSQKPVASPPVPLPARTRKKAAKQDKENKEETVGQSKKAKHALQRQKAVDDTPDRRKSLRKSMTVNEIPIKEEKEPATKTPTNKRTVPTNITPDNTYISPYVTTSRGKGSVRKENLNRSLRGLQSYSESSSSESGVAYFYTVLNNEISRLRVLCDTWTKYKKAEDLNEDANDLIDVAVGQTQLLINKKFKQFEGLIHACQTGVGAEKEVKCGDLQGFWDMMYAQVENLDIRFNKLTAMKDNNWEEFEPIVKPKGPKVVKKRAAPKTTKPAASSGIRAAILAARKQKQLAPSDLEKKDECEFNGGFFVVRTPNKNTPNKLAPKPTPKSILKSNKKKSIANLNKSVLFKEEDSESEESPLNTTFEKSPPKKEKTRRKSKKLF